MTAFAGSLSPGAVILNEAKDLLAKVLRFRERGFNLQFEVNGQAYFLNFDPAEGLWFVYEPTKDGMLAMPVHDDAAPLLMPSALMLDAAEAKKEN